MEHAECAEVMSTPEIVEMTTIDISNISHNVNLDSSTRSLLLQMENTYQHQYVTSFA